jgi:hypothetical protein
MAVGTLGQVDDAHSTLAQLPNHAVRADADRRGFLTYVVGGRASDWSDIQNASSDVAREQGPDLVDYLAVGGAVSLKQLLTFVAFDFTRCQEEILQPLPPRSIHHRSRG